MASWMATWSLTSILSNSSMQHTPWRETDGHQRTRADTPGDAPLPPRTHVVSQHQSSGLDHKLMGLLVPDHGRGQTGGGAGLAAGVDRPGAELLHMPETHTHAHPDQQTVTFSVTNLRMLAANVLQELALGRAGISDNADVDVSSQRGPLGGRLGNAAEQHEQDSALHLIVSWTHVGSSSVYSFSRPGRRADAAAAGSRNRPWMVGKRLEHRWWYRFLSWLISNTFSHSFSVIWLLMLSAVCSSSRISFPPNCDGEARQRVGSEIPQNQNV